MAHQHGHHHHGAEAGGGRLLIALLLNVGITVAQVIGGVLSGSLALIADAAHNGSDAASLGISYGAQRVAQRKADERRTFGYERAQVIGALINLTTLFVIAVYLAVEAVRRLFEPAEVVGTTMMIVGAIAFVEDAISTWLLWRGSKTSLNVRSAFIHLMGDTLATVAVLVGGFLIQRYAIYWIDPLLTGLIALYIFVHAAVEIRHSIRILMESAPEGFDLDAMVNALEALDGVEDVHHVHVWYLDEHRVAMEGHVVVDEDDLRAIERIKCAVRDRLHHDFGIEHATLEVELAAESACDGAVLHEAR